MALIGCRLLRASAAYVYAATQMTQKRSSAVAVIADRTGCSIMIGKNSLLCNIHFDAIYCDHNNALRYRQTDRYRIMPIADHTV